MIVDIHAHYFPKEYNDLLLRIGGRSLPEAARAATARPMRNDELAGIQKRLQQMEEAEVQLQVLSPAASPPYAEKEADAVAAARLINDAYADLARKYPGRFNAVVSLPLPHIDASLREMERGLDQLGMLGVSMTCSCFDRSTAEAEFEPLYQEMNRRRTVLNYHPIQNGICSPMINDYGFTVSVGASLEDAAIVLHLIARRIPERFPNIRYVVPHLGGHHPDAAPAARQSGPAPAPELAGAPERDRAPLLLRHRRSRLAGGAALCVEGLRRRSSRRRERLSRPARVRDVPAEFPLPPRVAPADRGRREDPPPQRADRPRARALTITRGRLQAFAGDHARPRR